MNGRNVARTCSLGPRLFLTHRGRGADLKSRAALHLLNSFDKARLPKGHRLSEEPTVRKALTVATPYMPPDDEAPAVQVRDALPRTG
jgi:hypothetical protein